MFQMYKLNTKINIVFILFFASFTNIQGKHVLKPKLNFQDFFSFLRDSYTFPEGRSCARDEYDFVIIGAGSAGCVLANRLTENGKFKVLVLEAGGAESIVTDIPAIAAYFQHTDYNWGYRTQKIDGICLAMRNQRCHWPRGKGIGGTSLINYMIYTRGFKEDWDRIQSYGNPGWSWDDVLPYYLKAEGANNLEGLENTEHHNRNGPLSVSYASHRTPLSDAFLEAGKTLGYKTVDYNANEQGFGRVQTTTIYGHRCSAAKAYLHKIKHRINLDIIPHATVTKININPDTKVAESVNYIKDGVEYEVTATKEVVLSAGPIASPQILMLSGIGPKDDLEKLNIDVIKDAPVGQNIYDHICFMGLSFLINATGIALTETRAAQLTEMFKWAQYGDGLLSMIGGVEGLGWIKTNTSDGTYGDVPDMELIFVSSSLASDESQSARKGIHMTDKFYNDVFAAITEKETFTVVPMNVHPKSKGYMKLRTKNPLHHPLLYYDYFSDVQDLNAQVEAIKFIIKLSETDAFQKYGAKLHDKHFPTCKFYAFGTDEYWACAVRSVSATLHHQIASCKMGPSEDPEAIVDHELKVHGIQQLRVIDSSIIPKPIAAHTNAPAIMIGEKGADMILKTHD